MITIRYQDKSAEFPVGTTYREIAEKLQKDYTDPILLVRTGNRLRELAKPVEQDGTVEFLTARDRDGMLCYERSALMLLCKAVYDVAGKEKVEKVYIKFSVDNGYYIEVRGGVQVDKSFTEAVKARMQELAAQDLPIEKRKVSLDHARRYFRENGSPDRESLLKYRMHSTVNLYSIEDYVDYYYGYMVPSTGYITAFDLVPYEAGMALLLPIATDPAVVAPFKPHPKVFRALQDASDWSETMGIDTVGKINDLITQGGLTELILMAEARQEMNIAEIARKISERPEVKCVLIAGPSSSGKTSFSHRLSVQLRGMGLTPHPIEVDNYFVDREFTPRDENGEYDFESILGVDIKQFNKDMLELMAGKEVAMPTFNFKTGHREYKGNTLRIGEKDILVIEGIHCLNDMLSADIPSEKKYRIFISALTQTNIDEHNRIPTSDGRLLRRMIRDARTRGYGAQETLSRWASVRRGEKNNILPFQDSADAVFNSALVYEFSVLKSYAEQLLFGIDDASPEYAETHRLLKFLDYFLAVDSSEVPHNSLLKEFIGGSIFKV